MTKSWSLSILWCDNEKPSEHIAMQILDNQFVFHSHQYLDLIPHFYNDCSAPLRLF